MNEPERKRVKGHTKHFYVSCFGDRRDPSTLAAARNAINHIQETDLVAEEKEVSLESKAVDLFSFREDIPVSKLMEALEVLSHNKYLHCRL